MLISPEYAALNRGLHDSSFKYGAGAWRKADVVAEIVRKRRYASILDYGCGKGSLKRALPDLDIREYDPCIEGKDGRPERADLVVCLDVLEHIEPHFLDAVLSDIAQLAKVELFCTIATHPSKDILADGRNAHLIIEDARWWLDRLATYFRIVWSDVHRGELVCRAKRV